MDLRRDESKVGTIMVLVGATNPEDYNHILHNQLLNVMHTSKIFLPAQGLQTRTVKIPPGVRREALDPRIIEVAPVARM